MSNLPNCKRLEVRSSSIEGYGVFATEPIAKGEILEEVPFVLFPRYTALGKAVYDLLNASGFIAQKETHADNLRANLRFKDPLKYYFKWFPPVRIEGDQLHYSVLPLGFGPIYNTSNTDNNADWKIAEKTFTFSAVRDIAKDEEIRTFYGYFVTQEGASFGCETVFNLAMDKYEDKSIVKRLRFDSPHSEQMQQTPSHYKISQLISESKSGLTIARIAGLLPSEEEKEAIDIPEDSPSLFIYQKLVEFKKSPFPMIKIYFSFEQEDDGSPRTESVTFQK